MGDVPLMDDNQFQQLLDWLNFSWSGYRKVKKGVKKRISRHMQELNCPNITGYLDLLKQHDEVHQECKRRMTVSISRFFRDQDLWRRLEKDLVPGLIKPTGKNLHLWSAGCARGEEVYSFKILWERLKERYARLPELKIIATDLHPVYIDQAIAGIYTPSSLKKVQQLF